MLKNNLLKLLFTLTLLLGLSSCSSTTPNKAASSKNEVTLYGVSWCGHCQHARQYFKKNNIAYNDYDVEESEKYRKEFDKLGGTGYPLIFINGTRIEGFDEEAIKEALNKL